MTVVKSDYERQPHDAYETPAVVTEILLRHYPVTNLTVWEPAAGTHAMADVMRDHGAARVYTSDITTGSRTHDFMFDFMSDVEPPISIEDAIVTNPPYGPGNVWARRFAELALKRCHGWVALLLTATFDSGSTRKHLFRDNPRFDSKLVLLDRIKWFEHESKPGLKGTTDHSWYIWRPSYLPIKPPRLIYEEEQLSER